MGTIPTIPGISWTIEDHFPAGVEVRATFTAHAATLLADVDIAEQPPSDLFEVVTRTLLDELRRQILEAVEAIQ